MKLLQRILVTALAFWIGVLLMPLGGRPQQQDLFAQTERIEK